MKIRSITYFLNPDWPLNQDRLLQAGMFNRAACESFVEAGYEVQTSRLATIPFPHLVTSANIKDTLQLAQSLEAAGGDLGFDYVSIGPAVPESIADFQVIPAVLEHTSIVFAAGSMTSLDGTISTPAVRACARTIKAISTLTPDGFSNLRFAGLANVSPGAPFFPAAYHSGEQPAFALAIEAADLAVGAVQAAQNLADMRSRLISSIEEYAEILTELSIELSRRFSLHFGGIDFSLAPFPVEEQSLGTALELLGVPAAGLHGSLAAAAFLADTLDRASFLRAGFNGLFLPVLEDATLAARASEGVLTVKDLLLYASVCGTGLDTVPLPGDTSEEQLYAILLDLAALAHRLDKPLTGRLMPLPGKAAGDPTTFDFAYFANSRVLPVETLPLEGLLALGDTLVLNQRS